jgi:hypothetical protein
MMEHLFSVSVVPVLMSKMDLFKFIPIHHVLLLKEQANLLRVTQQHIMILLLPLMEVLMA